MLDKGPNSLFCIWIFSFPRTIYWKDSFPHWMVLTPLFKIIWSYYMRVYFGAFYSIPLVFMIIFIPTTYCFYYYCFAVSFEIRKCESSYFVHFLKTVLATWGLSLHMHFRIFFLFLPKKKKNYWGFDRHCTESVDYFG